MIEEKVLQFVVSPFVLARKLITNYETIVMFLRWDLKVKY